jgi:hypothetical protein
MKSLSIKALALHALSVFALVLLASCGGGTANIPLAFSASLNAAQEVPPTSSQGTGTGIVTVDPTDRSLRASVITTGVGETAVNIHEGAPGATGPVVFSLTKQPGSIVWHVGTTATDAQLATLQAGNYYFNVTSQTAPNGEIRGQISNQLINQQQRQVLQQLQQQSAAIAMQLQLIARAQGL